MEQNWNEPEQQVSTITHNDSGNLEHNDSGNLEHNANGESNGHTYNNVNTDYVDYDLTKSNGQTYNNVNTGYNDWDLSKPNHGDHPETAGTNGFFDDYINTQFNDEGYANAEQTDDWEIETNNHQNSGYKSNVRRQGQGNKHLKNANGTENKNAVSEKPKSTYIPPEFEEDNNLTIEAGSNFIKYDKIEVTVSGMEVKNYITSFEDSGLCEILLENLKKCHYITPTPIQKYSLPIIMDGRDMIASAQTGSGKTAAFVLPILNNLLSDPTELIVDCNHCEPQALIMSPTRELAIQICEVATRLSRGTAIKSELLYGGTATYYQRQKILRGVHIIVATPGRLIDFVNRGVITFSSLRFFILDEADRMLDLGFQNDVERILNDPTMIPPSFERSTVMFSATMPDNVQEIAKSYMKPDYVSVAVGEVGGACKDVTQTFINVNKFSKKKNLLALLKGIDDCQGIIVFVEQKRTADFIAAYISEMNIPTTSIHGGREQPEREIALKDFKTKKMKVLVATAVAARGLDIMGVTMVVNFDLPKTVEEYVHRIGRTGRLGNSGKAVSFYDPEADYALVPQLVNSLKRADQEIPDFFSQFGEETYDPDNQFNDIRTDVTVHSVCIRKEDNNDW